MTPPPLRPIAARVPGLLVALAIAVVAAFLAGRYRGPQLLFALLLGMAFHFASQSPRIRPGVEFASRTVLRVGVALLGARIGLEQIAGLGVAPALIVVTCVCATILFGWALSRSLGRTTAEGVLTGGAVAICGASAALALSAVLPQGREQHRFTLLTVVAVTTLSTAAMILYPAFAELLRLGPRETAVFLGGSIHDVAQVVGAGLMVSAEVGETATLVKLMRVAMLLPVVVFVAHAFRRAGTDRATGRREGAHDLPAAASRRPPALPVFLVAFAALVAANGMGLVPAALGAALGEVSRGCLVVAIAALGVQTSFAQLAELGWRPVAMIVGETLFLAAAVLAGLAIAA